MGEIKAVLTRIQVPENEDKQTLGHLDIYEGVHKIGEAYVLELPWRQNQRSISCIPAGEYTVKKRKAEESPSRSYDHFIVQDVPDRSYILWHAGNYHWHIEGCLLMGTDFTDINADGLLDVVNTRFKIQQLYNLLPDSFQFIIVEI